MYTRFLTLPLLAIALFACAAAPEDDATSEAVASPIIESEQSSRPVPASSVKISMDDGENFCTGVLVDAWHVLTEKHCVTNADFPAWKTWTVIAGARRVVAERAPKQPSTTVAILALRQPVRIPAYAQLAVMDAGKSAAAYAVGRKKEERTAALVASKPLSVTRPADAPDFLRTRCYSSGGGSGGGLYLIRPPAGSRDVVLGFEHDPEGWCDDPDPTKTATLHDLFTPVTPELVALVKTLARP